MSISYMLDYTHYSTQFVSNATMPRRQQQNRNLPGQKRALIVGFRLSGRSVQETAAHFNESVGTVSKLVAKHRRSGDLQDRPRSGRPRVTSQLQDNEIRRIVRRNRHITGNTFRLIAYHSAILIFCDIVRTSDLFFVFIFFSQRNSRSNAYEELCNISPNCSSSPPQLRITIQESSPQVPAHA